MKSSRPRLVPRCAPRPVVALVLLVVSPVLIGGLGPTVAHGALARTVARNDSVSTSAGASTTIDVLRNDRIVGGRQAARVRVLSAPDGITLRVTRQRRIMVQVSAALPTGSYTARYRLSSRGRSGSDAATVVVTVTAREEVPAPTPEALPPLTPELLDAYRIQALGHLNAYRAQHGLPPVVLQDELNDFAQARAEEVYAGSDRRQIDTAVDFFELFGSGGLAFCEGVDHTPQDGPGPVRNINYLRAGQLAGFGYHYDASTPDKQPVWTAYLFDADPRA